MKQSIPDVYLKDVDFSMLSKQLREELAEYDKAFKRAVAEDD